jgi:predicted nucleotidyltransferase
VQSADPALIGRLRTALEGLAGIRLAVLFGSAASGRARADSDVDVAVLVEHDLDAGAESRLTRTLSLATGRNVDLIGLQRASTLLKWQVASKGVPLVERTPGEFARFRAGAASEYLEFAPAFSYHGEIFRRKLIEQGRAL